MSEYNCEFSLNSDQNPSLEQNWPASVRVQDMQARRAIVNVKTYSYWLYLHLLEYFVLNNYNLLPIQMNLLYNMELMYNVDGMTLPYGINRSYRIGLPKILSCRNNHQEVYNILAICNSWHLHCLTFTSSLATLWIECLPTSIMHYYIIIEYCKSTVNPTWLSHDWHVTS